MYHFLTICYTVQTIRPTENHRHRFVDKRNIRKLRNIYKHNMNRSICHILLLLILLLSGCNPYGSSDANKKLLQGKWRLIHQNYLHPDSTKVNILQDTVFITFKKDSIFELINSDYKQPYNYKIKKFQIDWFVENTFVTKSRIVKLSQDTLKMETLNDFRIFVKE